MRLQHAATGLAVAANRGGTKSPAHANSNKQIAVKRRIRKSDKTSHGCFKRYQEKRASARRTGPLGTAAVGNLPGESTVIASGGIADARGFAASLVPGAKAVQIGTFFRSLPAQIHPAWAKALATGILMSTKKIHSFSQQTRCLEMTVPAITSQRLLFRLPQLGRQRPE